MMVSGRIASRAALSCAALAAGALAAGVASGASGMEASGSSAAAGRPPVRDRSGGDISYVGTFADKRWEGRIRLGLWRDATHVSTVQGIAPGPCNDRDFGPVVPGRDGASGAVLDFSSLTLGKIGNGGSFSLSGEQEAFVGGPRGTVSVSGTFFGDVVRGRVKARITTSYDTCVANIAFTARRVRRAVAVAPGPVTSAAPGRLPPAGRWRFTGNVETGTVDGDVGLTVEDGHLVQVYASAPGPCRRPKGGSELAGAIFDAEQAVRIEDDGSFSLTVRQPGTPTRPETTATMRGRFYGNSARVWVSIRNGKGNVFSSCKADARFWARRDGT